MLMICLEVDSILTTFHLTTKLVPNNGKAVSQLEYSQVIVYLMYDMKSTRPGSTFVVGKLNRYTSNPSEYH